MKNGKYTRINNKLICNAIDYGKNRCQKYVECDKCVENQCVCGLSQIYCSHHTYFTDFTEQQINDIKEQRENMIICKSCRRWKDNNSKQRCAGCIIKYEKEMEKKRDAKKYRVTCEVILHCGTKCSYEKYGEKNGYILCKKHYDIEFNNLVWKTLKNVHHVQNY